jgi:BirA family biotin operon repressor/biotin-[acetyl-CoA-carboxylase] ligase
MEFKVHTYSQLPSTQDYIKDLAAEDFAEGEVIQCLIQTKGRGRHGNEWTSPMGNLYMSVLLRPDCKADEAGQISFVAAVALSAAIAEYLDEKHTKTLKWPNDILIDGKKCAGILLESDLKGDKVESLALGMGVNIMAAPEGAVGLNAVTWDIQVPIHPFRDKVLEHLDKYYTQWKKEGFAPIRELWLKEAHGLGQSITARLADKSYEGIFEALDEKGALLLKKDNGDILDISAGEVYFSD